jgi:hypothetical protein
MASEQEHLNQAAVYAKQTSWVWDKYLREIRENPAYNYKNTPWYRCGAELEKVARPGTPPNPIPPPSSTLASVQGRIFLANSPLDCLAAPSSMVPVCTADPGYRDWYDEETIDRLFEHFGIVECWCDCREPGGNPSGTPYSVAIEMVEELGLDGPAWGQCESSAEFDHAYAGGARRMVGNLSALTDVQRSKIASTEVLVTVELYRNVQPWMYPDWMNCNAGIGGNCIACYGSENEGATYMSVDTYKTDGLYNSGADSVYGVGLQPADWAAL